MLPAMRAHHLLIVLHVQRVLGLGGGQHLVQVASPRQVSVLDRGVGQKLGDFVDVRALAGFVQKQQQRVQCARIVAHMGDHGMQAAQQFGRVGRQQAIGVPRVNVERLVILTEAGATLRQQKQPLGIVVHGQQLLGDRGSLGQSFRFAGMPSAGRASLRDENRGRQPSPGTRWRSWDRRFRARPCPRSSRT